MGNPILKLIPVNKQPKEVNPFELLMQALEKAQNTLSAAQIQNAKAAEFDANLQTNIYNYWNSKLNSDETKIKNDKKKSKKMMDAEKQMNVDSAAAQSNETGQQGTIQAAQSQTQTDASNLQQLANQLQAPLMVLSALSNMLGNINA